MTHDIASFITSPETGSKYENIITRYDYLTFKSGYGAGAGLAGILINTPMNIKSSMGRRVAIYIYISHIHRCYVTGYNVQYLLRTF